MQDFAKCAIIAVLKFRLSFEVQKLLGVSE